MRIILAATAFLLGVVVMSLYPSVTSVEASCNPSPRSGGGVQLRGWKRSGSFTGVRANIEEYDPFVYSIGGLSGADVALWNSSESRYASAGWVKRPGLGGDLYASLLDAGGSSSTYYEDDTNGIGSLQQAQVTYSSSYFVFTAGGTYLKTGMVAGLLHLPR